MSYSLQEVLELADGARGPAESLGGVPQVAHDEAVFPTTLASSGSAQVGGWRGPIVNSPEPMKLG